MFIELTSWLEKTIDIQLMLGQAWLIEKNRQKALGLKSESEKSWRDLYHDNGSCLDITEVFDPPIVRYLSIVQACLTFPRYHLVHIT
jgi:hypothetical protein